MVHCAAYDCSVEVGRPKTFSSANFEQITPGDNQRREQAVMTTDLRASSSKTTPNLTVQAKK